MKKFTKFSLIAAAGLFVTGCLLGSISAFAGGGIVIRDNDMWTERVLDGVGNVIYRMTDGRMGHQASGQAESGKNQKDQIALSEISEIEMELGAGNFYLVEKAEDDGLIDVCIEEVVGHCSYEVEKGKLHISGFQNIRNAFNKDISKNRVEVRVPQGSYFEEVELEVGACYMEVSGVEAGKLDVTLGAAELILTDLDLHELDADVGAGRVAAEDVRIMDGDISVGAGECAYGGTILGNLEVECNVGNIDLSLTGSETDHDYEIECSMGNVEVGSFYTVGLGREKHINNHTGSMFEIKCDMGNITISFED